MQPLINALAWTLAHSLWQGLLAALLAAMIISITGKTKARLRYNSLGIVFILFLATVLITFGIQFRQASALLTTETSGNEGTVFVNNSTEIINGGFIADLTDWFNNNSSLLMLAWALFFLVNCIKLVAGLATVNRLRHYKVHPVNEEWKTKLLQLQDELGIRQSITLLQSELIKVPVALGFLKPVILLPVGMLANIPPGQAEAILLHELGHIGRKDYLVNFLQHFAEAIFFFNPAILWISSLLRQEREACCDDIVVAKMGKKKNYLNALVSFQEYTFVHSRYAVGFSSKRQYLLGRVKRIITNENKKLNLLEKTALLSGLLLFSAFSYIAQKKEINDEPLTVPVEQYNIQQANEFIIKKIQAEPGVQPVREENKKISRPYKPLTDTLPRKKDKAAQAVPDKPKDELSTEKVLEEIKQIKEQIGKRKESIGAKKEQLKGQEKNTKEEKAIKDQIEKERDEIEGKRDELEKKRELLDNLKKQKANERKTAMKKEMKIEMQTEKQNELKENIEKKSEKKYELKHEINKNIEKKNEMKNEIKNEMKKQDDKTELFNNKKSKLFQYTSETKPANIFTDSKPDNAKLFKVSPGKPEEDKYPSKKEIQSKTAPPKSPQAKENIKSLSPPKAKALPVYTQ